jgi:hypothetical protein
MGCSAVLLLGSFVASRGWSAVAPWLTSSLRLDSGATDEHALTTGRIAMALSVQTWVLAIHFFT